MLKRGISTFGLSLFLLTLIVVLASCQRGRQVNCKKMVFAPICRGVAAKRSGKVYYQNQIQPAYTQKSLNRFLSTEKLPPYWFYAAKTYQ